MRVIPTLLIKNRRLIKTIGFHGESYLGDPINAIKLFNDYQAHELIIVNISDGNIDFEYLKILASKCRMPVSYGGGIRKVEEALKVINIGFDKIILNTLLFQSLVEAKTIIQKLGSQSIIGCVEVEENEGSYLLRQSKEKSIDDFCRELEEMGVGELYLYDTSREGTMRGLNVERLQKFYSRFTVPFIVGGGVGSYVELDQLKTSDIHGLACGSLFVFYGSRKAVLINYDLANDDM